MKIIDISAGRRAVWFDKNHRDAVYVDIRPEVEPTLIADARALPAEIGEGYDLVVFDCPIHQWRPTHEKTDRYTICVVLTDAGRAALMEGDGRGS